MCISSVTRNTGKSSIFFGTLTWSTSSDLIFQYKILISWRSNKLCHLQILHQLYRSWYRCIFKPNLNKQSKCFEALCVSLSTCFENILLVVFQFHDAFPDVIQGSVFIFFRRCFLIICEPITTLLLYNMILQIVLNLHM